MKFWVTHYGIPRTIITDNGIQFQSNMMSILYSHLGIEGRRTSPHHPQSNSQVERLNRVIKEALRTMCDANQKDWPDHLDSIAFAYRTAVQESTGLSPYQLLFGRQPVLPVDILYGEPSKVEAMERDEGKYHLRLTTNLREAWKLAFSKNEEQENVKRNTMTRKLRIEHLNQVIGFWRELDLTPRRRSKKPLCCH